ncbi:MAG: HD domain-containing protein [Thermofilum sp.]
MVKLRVLDNLYWSSCPDSETVAALAREGVSLVVDLTMGECRYALPQGVEKLEYPIPDFSFKAFEDVLVGVALPVLERLKQGERVLVHCRGGIGRSGVVVSMILGLRSGASAGEVKEKLARLGFQGETLSQQLAFRWFFRARDLIGPGWIAAVVKKLKNVGGERGGSYWATYAAHASTVANVALDVLETISDSYGLSKAELRSAYAAGLLHDVGRVLASSENHHAAGALFAAEMPEVRSCCNPLLVAKAVLHHRRATDLLGDVELRRMGTAAQLVAAAVRLADAFNSVYEGEGLYRGVELRGSRLVFQLEWSLIARAGGRLSEKARTFTALTGLEVEAELA